MIGDKIAVDSGVFNPDLLTTKYGRQIGEQWENTRLRDRLDAVTAHEYAEAGGLDHKEAVQRAADTPLAIREKARQMLRIIADAENRGTGR